MTLCFDENRSDSRRNNEIKANSLSESNDVGAYVLFENAISISS